MQYETLSMNKRKVDVVVFSMIDWFRVETTTKNLFLYIIGISWKIKFMIEDF